MFNKLSDAPEIINHSHSTRFAHHVRPEYERLSLTQHSLKYSGPTYWNSLPDNIKQVQSVASFKRILKNSIISYY